MLLVDILYYYLRLCRNEDMKSKTYFAFLFKHNQRLYPFSTVVFSSSHKLPNFSHLHLIFHAKIFSLSSNEKERSMMHKNNICYQQNVLLSLSHFLQELCYLEITFRYKNRKCKKGTSRGYQRHYLCRQTQFLLMTIFPLATNAVSFLIRNAF